MWKKSCEISGYEMLYPPTSFCIRGDTCSWKRSSPGKVSFLRSKKVIRVRAMRQCRESKDSEVRKGRLY